MCVPNAMMKASSVAVKPAPARAQGTATCVVFPQRGTLASITALYWKKFKCCQLRLRRSWMG